MKMKLLLTALAIAGFAGSTIMSTTADAKTKKHPTSSSTTTGMGSGSSTTTTGMSTGKTKGSAANPSSQGNVGPGTSNNAGPSPGGR
jgi:hypothetical protein